MQASFHPVSLASPDLGVLGIEDLSFRIPKEHTSLQIHEICPGLSSYFDWSHESIKINHFNGDIHVSIESGSDFAPFLKNFSKVGLEKWFLFYFACILFYSLFIGVFPTKTKTIEFQKD